MKKLILLIFFSITLGTCIYGQCNKKIILTGSSIENLNASDEVQNIDDRAINIVYDSTVITFTAGDIPLKGTVKTISCDWKIPFKEGKTVLKVTLTRTDETTVDGTLTIVSKAGKNVLIAEFDGSDYKKQRLTLEKFEENK